METRTAERLAEALDEGRAYAELADVTLTLVSGTDARAWLQDLVTTDVESLGPSEARPSLLLTPTGRVRASFQVLALEDGEFLLAQSSDQPERIGEALAPYVLSSDVAIHPSTMRIFAIPGRSEPPGRTGLVSRPSILGGGVDLLVVADDDSLDEARRLLTGEGLEPAPADAVEARRIRRGRARFPVDVDPDSLPAEAGWDAAPVTDRAKGCFLGQEAVARVGNLGHPTRLVVPALAERPLRAGDTVHADGRRVGLVTSASGTAVIVRLRWDARDLPLDASGGTPLRRT